MFRFPVHPASIDIGAGLEVAWNAFTGSWSKWLPVVVVASIIQGLPYVMMGGETEWYRIDKYTGQIVTNPALAGKVDGIILAFMLATLASVVAGWLVTAIAIAGLRNRPISGGWVVSSGLKSIGAGILVGLAFVASLFVGYIAIVIVALVAGPLALLVLFAGIVALVYLMLRWIFFTLAIFDGEGPVSGLAESWALSEKSVLRLFGWGLVGVAISIGFGIAAGILGVGFRTNAAAISQILSSLVTEIGTVYLLFLMVVLYESQRARVEYASAWQSRPQQPGAPYGMPYPGPGYPQAPGYPGASYPGAENQPPHGEPQPPIQWGQH